MIRTEIQLDEATLGTVAQRDGFGNEVRGTVECMVTFLLFYAAERYTLRHSIWRWRPLCGVAPMSAEMRSGSATSGSGTF